MRIEVKAMLYVQRPDGGILVSRGLDEVKNQHFYRLLGGHVEFGETAEEAIRREIREEINSEIEDLELVTVIENIFTYQGVAGHEIDYLYKGSLARKELYAMTAIPMQEGELTLQARWASLSDTVPFYPPFDYQGLNSF